MTETEKDPTQQVETARKAFEQEFERFARFTADSGEQNGLDLEQTLSEQRALAELRTRHVGKKSSLAATKKLIGRVAPDQRGAFGQLVQSVEASILSQLDKADEYQLAECPALIRCNST